MVRNPPIINRRAVLKSGAALSLSAIATGVTAGKVRDSPSSPEELTVEEAALELAEHPTKPVTAFTTTFLKDGYQLYLIRGKDSVEKSAESAKKVTDAKAGVHGLSWETGAVSGNGRSVLQYSMDGKTYQGDVRGVSIKRRQKISDEPVDPRKTPLASESVPTSGSSGFVTTQTRRVSYCVNPPFIPEFCVNARGPETGRLRCDNAGGNTPPIEHYQFEVLRSGDALSGVSFWAGQQTTDSCFWVGEENYTQWCWKYCQGDGVPGVSALAGAIETAINKAADAAGIAIPGFVVVALAYAIATGLIVIPPTGVPG